MIKSCIVLCSGGIDSVVTSYLARRKYSKMTILFFDYGQKSLSMERKLSKKTAKKLKASFISIKLDFLNIISGSLINKQGKCEVKSLKDTRIESEKYYVPCRNLIFLNYALALAESIYIKKKEINDILVGFKNEGKESYPDTTEEFVREINRLAKMTCKKPFKILAPLIKKDKEDIILIGNKLGVNFKETFSCYQNSKKHCGQCLSCKLRQAGFYWANVRDNTDYYT